MLGLTLEGMLGCMLMYERKFGHLYCICFSMAQQKYPQNRDFFCAKFSLHSYLFSHTEGSVEIFICIPDRNFREPDWGKEMSSYMRGVKDNSRAWRQVVFLTSWCQFLTSQHQFLMSFSAKQKENYARKRIQNGCLVRIENSITRNNCSASLGYPCDGISIRISQPLKDSYSQHYNDPKTSV